MVAHRAIGLLVVTWVFVSCDNGLRPVESDTDTDTDTDTDSDVFPDPWNEVVADPSCTTATPGATSRYLGDFVVEGDEVSGTEYWTLVANPAWIAAEGGDCVVAWDITGETGSPGACEDCDYSMSIEASVAYGRTTCNALLYLGQENWTDEYDVKINTDGTTEFSYSSTGLPLGGWYAEGTRVTFLTDADCVFF